MNHEPVFLTDKSRDILLEAVSGMPNAAVPDTLKPFEILEPNTTDGAMEKHAPAMEIRQNHVTVKVGSVFHPMTEDHSITFICLLTDAGCLMRVPLTPGCEPVAHFTLEEGDSPKAAYAFCNLHGYWKTEL